jgi:hypothetical protein
MKQWINSCDARYKELKSFGVSDKNARPVARSRKGPRAMSNMMPVKEAFPNRFFANRGLPSLIIMDL